MGKHTCDVNREYSTDLETMENKIIECLNEADDRLEVREIDVRLK